MKKQYGLTAQGEALPESQGVGLFLNVQRGRIRPVAAKSAAGRENLRLSLVPTHAPAWFFVGTRPPSLGAALLYLLGSFCCVMAVRAGQPQGWPVSKVAGFSPLSGLPPMSVRTPGGRENLTTLEAAIMATVPTRAISSPSQAWLSCVQNDTPTHCDLLFDELEHRIYTIDLCSFDRRQITTLLHALRTEVSLLQEAV